ncbi:uncharacterized protein COLE_04091 [Cutaneotrichosporon oleaginosum]|uniref:uncharacterized protein n=1 Tax=Cutaneotrichosporon oleaginosum TaxID=879819 RepID=UPI0013229078|nr:hypothetical protein COLE_04091 [Cutaneotrichosporon oleaginosum]
MPKSKPKQKDPRHSDSVAARNRARRIGHLRRHLADPETPLRDAYATELEALLKVQDQPHAAPSGTIARAIGRLRNIDALRRLANTPNNPRREKHADELRRAEAAQARYERYCAHIPQPARKAPNKTAPRASHNTLPKIAVIDASSACNTVTVSFGDGTVVNAQQVHGSKSQSWVTYRKALARPRPSMHHPLIRAITTTSVAVGSLVNLETWI